MKAFKHIFTSPSSALKTDIEGEHAVQPKRQHKLDECRTRSHIAALLGMKSVSPRAIAYIAVQVSYMLFMRNGYSLISLLALFCTIKLR